MEGGGGTAVLGCVERFAAVSVALLPPPGMLCMVWPQALSTVRRARSDEPQRLYAIRKGHNGSNGWRNALASAGSRAFRPRLLVSGKVSGSRQMAHVSMPSVRVEGMPRAGARPAACRRQRERQQGAGSAGGASFGNAYLCGLML